ncbi:class I SAM-dependent methyltransferase [Daejeonella lutea]|uniref:Methyltransferase domain-containing protein n=1 Tax=Daejeonella lutea TaxID=572036 RepID=A0A1T5AJG0_9SPHI|nr:class I SAM-dependent methyltransferase [Daejeonella lutea]SKB35134.1 Methyltransferase domain-containing protein [Daejeonella lutea]
MKDAKRKRSGNSNDPEFWESAFAEKQAMWGLEPAKSALIAKDLFKKQNAKTVLVPGIGYGRNAEEFTKAGMRVTGIEISVTAIELLREFYGRDMTVYQGSVSEMPFDKVKYDGIFCYALIHLLGEDARHKLIRDCYDQLVSGGLMIFTVIPKTAPTYGKGKKISEDRYELVKGAPLYFYDKASVEAEFGEFGLLDIQEISEKPPKHSEYEDFPFFVVICRKG